ncbi:polycystic kidney disease 2 [Thecamonas trahens ATCC 50062]|uniref:Polycystic kidney disease 2 n=1 Tax=Thecamonas trahens ATCC 50062 TaxID=461836 RepID=A0A0L0DRG2_THETB|nr:polycystic kidney disease 2 [Thecamonas trahens ATCC 50062]KNC54914.1 polycystic kidney disease 2 [Thecamonas trahens ATCC 50062]|eukprot:XP_013753504.1 polycystic kidney disease 2 [Thecamonas trahens ATCC 50062]
MRRLFGALKAQGTGAVRAEEYHARMAKFAGELKEELERAVQKKKLRATVKVAIREMVVYFVFLTVFSFVVLGARDPLYSFQYNEFMKDLFLAEEFPEPDIYKTFYDVATFEEFWEFMHDVFVPALFADQGGFGEGYIYGQNVLVGAVRLRQVRVSRGHCQPEGPFGRVITSNECFARYSRSLGDTARFGPEQQFVYSSAKELDTVPQLARLQLFEGGGYVEYFPASLQQDEHAQHMRDLENGTFVDLQTRALFIDFTTYNTNVNLFHVAQLTFEFLPSGGVFPSATFRVMRLYKYNNDVSGTIQFVLEMILIIMVLGYFVEEVWELYDTGCWEYWHNLWNVIDWINLLLFLAAFCVRIALVATFEKMNLDPRATTRFYNFQTLVLLNSAENNILASNAFILWFKVYKYTKFFPPMRTVSDTIARSIQNTIGFVAVVMFVLFGFAQAGVLAFGSDVEDFRSFIDTFYTLLRLLLGDFDFETMQYSNRVFGPLYFLFFMVVVFFVMLSMFLAILNDSYLQVQAENKARSEKELNVVEAFRDWVNARTAFLRKRQERIRDFSENIRTADANADAVLDLDELRQVFNMYEDEARELLGVNSAEELLARFDVDGNSVLDAEEQARLVRAIEQWNSRAQAETDQIVELNEDIDDPTVAGVDRQIALYMAALKQDMRVFARLETTVERNLLALLDASGIGRDAYLNEMGTTSYSSED